MEKTQRDSLGITDWLEWFLECLGRALSATDQTLESVLRKARLWEKPETHLFACFSACLHR
ncbi:hypothetical protein [Pedobacter psychroterrae]|uniref:Uncharacterized protein n=1 Tax=Pedobacter psychroterrae TaxID=2530453 RepID=A0A4R0NE02_9SPHI|nr:hypothetical protein [Pedobacter psychroterrae]TCC97342.1 hypothetical protein EZ437_19840 [Pedobacter psychroterrae]